MTAAVQRRLDTVRQTIARQVWLARSEVIRRQWNADRQTWPRWAR